MGADGAGGGVMQQHPKLAERRLDRAHVGGIRRQIDEPGMDTRAPDP